MNIKLPVSCFILILLFSLIACRGGIGPIFPCEGNCSTWTFEESNAPSVPYTGIRKPSNRFGASLKDSIVVNDDGSVVLWGTPNFDQKIIQSLNNIQSVYFESGHALFKNKSGSTLYLPAKAEADFSLVLNSRNDIRSFSASGDYGLILTQQGTVEYVGDSEWLSKNDLQPPTDLVQVIQVEAGYSHALALQADGTVIAWGKAPPAESATKSDRPENHFSRVPPGIKNIVAIHATSGAYNPLSSSQNLAIKADGSVVLWGANTRLSFGADTTVLPDGLTDEYGAVAVKSFGSGYYAVLRQNNSLVIWNSDTEFTYDGIAEIVAKDSHLLALKTDGRWFSVGDCGYISAACINPEEVGGLKAISSQTSGYTLSDSGKGKYLYYDDSLDSERKNPTVEALSQLTQITHVNSTPDTIIVLQDSGLLNVSKRQNNGEAPYTYYFFTLDNVESVSGHLALKKTGKVVSIFNEDSFLGWKSDDDKWEFDFVATLDNVKMLSVGFDGVYRMSLAKSGELTLWSASQRNINENTPGLFIPKFVEPIQSIAAGKDTVAAITQSGEVVIWDPKTEQVISSGTIYQSHRDLAVWKHCGILVTAEGELEFLGEVESCDLRGFPEGLSGVTQITMDDKGVFALKEDGTLISWGNLVIPSSLSDIQVAL